MELKDNSDKKQLKEVHEENELEDFSHLPKTTKSVSDSTDEKRKREQEIQDNDMSKFVIKEEEEEIIDFSEDAVEGTSMVIKEENLIESSTEVFSSEIEKTKSVDNTENNEKEMTCLLQEVSDTITDIDEVVSLLTNDLQHEDFGEEEENQEVMDSLTENALQKELEQNDESNAGEDSKFRKELEVDTVSNDSILEDKKETQNSNETSKINEENKHTEELEENDEFDAEGNSMFRKESEVDTDCNGSILEDKKQTQNLNEIREINEESKHTEELEGNDEFDSEGNSKFGKELEVDTVSNDSVLEDKKRTQTSNETNETCQVDGTNTSMASVENNKSPKISNNAAKRKIPQGVKNKKDEQIYNINSDAEVINNLIIEDIKDFTTDDYAVSFPLGEVKSPKINNELENVEGNAAVDVLANSLLDKQTCEDAKNVANSVLKAQAKRKRKKYNKNNKKFEVALNHIIATQQLPTICNITNVNKKTIDNKQQNKSQKSRIANSVKTPLAPSKNDKWAKLKQKRKNKKQQAKNVQNNQDKSSNHNDNSTMELIKEVLKYVKMTTTKLLPNIEVNSIRASTSTQAPTASGSNTGIKKKNANAGKNKNANKQTSNIPLNQKSSQENITATKNLNFKKKCGRNRRQIIKAKNNAQGNKNIDDKNKDQIINPRNKPQAKSSTYVPQQKVPSNKQPQPRKQNNTQKNNPGQHFKEGDNNFVSNKQNSKQNTSRKISPSRNQQRTQSFNNKFSQNKPNVPHRHTPDKQRNYNMKPKNSQNRNNSPLPSLLNMPLPELFPTRNRSSENRSYSPNRNSRYSSRQPGSSVPYERSRKRQRSISPEYQSRRNRSRSSQRDVGPPSSKSNYNEYRQRTHISHSPQRDIEPPSSKANYNEYRQTTNIPHSPQIDIGSSLSKSNYNEYRQRINISHSPQRDIESPLSKSNYNEYQPRTHIQHSPQRDVGPPLSDSNYNEYQPRTHIQHSPQRDVGPPLSESNYNEYQPRTHIQHSPQRDVGPLLSNLNYNPRNMTNSTFIPAYHTQESDMNTSIRINEPRMGSSDLYYNDRTQGHFEQFARPPMRRNEPRMGPSDLNYVEGAPRGSLECSNGPSPSTFSPDKKTHTSLLKKHKDLYFKMQQRDRMLKELEYTQREIDTSLEALYF